MKVYDEHGQPYPPPQEPRRDDDARRNDGPQSAEDANQDNSATDITELLAGNA